MDVLEKLRSLKDRYAIEREIGSGGMATVSLARDLKHDREVALKVLRADLSAVIGTERFLAEVRIAAKLDHPHILTLIDSGSADGLLYYVLPYVRGESLRAKLDREKQLGVQDALSITTQVASALDYAHAQGVVHRDIKPENILLHEGEAVLADFGIALAVKEAAGNRLTETGLSLGTPKYMSPEQAMGDRALDRRSDVYSLGAVFYEMIAGEPPVTGPSAQAIIAKLLTEKPVRLRVVRNTIPVAMERATEKALAKTPVDRFNSAGEFARALSAAAPARDSSIGGSRMMWAVIGIAAVAVGTGLLIVRSKSSEPVAAATVRDAATPVRLAVLPFENLGSAEEAYFADGLTDEVRGKLSELPGLEVIARASSNEYRLTRKSPEDIARELGAPYLLTGTVRSERGTSGRPTRLRVSPELVEVRAGGRPVTKWQRPFEAQLTDVFVVQAAIAAQVAGALDVALVDGRRRKLGFDGVMSISNSHGTESLDAHDFYLRGRYLANKFTQADLERSLELYRKAIAADSQYAAPWVGIAEVWTTSADFYFEPNKAYPNAKAAAVKAIALAPNFAEAQNQLALVRLFYDWDLSGARDAFERARTLAPNSSDILNGYGQYLIALGAVDSALVVFRRSRALDPLASNPAFWLSWLLSNAGRTSEGIAVAREALVDNPHNPMMHLALALSLLRAGQAEAGLASARAGASVGALATAVIARAQAASGRTEDARRTLAELEIESRRRYVDPVMIAFGYAALGDRDATFRWLEKGYISHSANLLTLNSLHEWDAIRSDPRYAPLVQRIRRR